MPQSVSSSSIVTEVRLLSSALLRCERNPALFPAHVQRLRSLAFEVRRMRSSLGISQECLAADSLPLERAGRVVYALYDHRGSDVFYLASREPAGIDLYRLYLFAQRNRGNPLLDYLRRTDFSLLGIYPLESIAVTGVPFSVISRSRLIYWRSVLLY
ncbi:hypothetical protein BBOV_III004270 [Babesia bovis T2Bo]|uniref:hypothetical protein n=1 Tax=Babesia bovis T2Bo TaxID=484906 RepID=UPI001C351B25|nr:hypothetical protein BBOV_III004270 [Babesia bovis T2Bo]EDO07989.2 hypothetical protein BBOV_III004270 [Babesia bovis T2Bo]